MANEWTGSGMIFYIGWLYFDI